MTSDKWRVTSRQRQSSVEFRFAEATARQASGAQGRRNDTERDSGSRAGAASSAPTKAKRPWAKYRVARLLGVSHTWVNKLVRRFEADKGRMRRKMAAFAPASLEKLERAREETRRQRELGWLRGPIRYRRVKVVLYGKKRKVIVPTKGNKRQIPYAATRRPVPFAKGAQDRRDDSIPLPYRKIPEWARGLLLPGDPGTVQRRTPATAGKPRPVPFAFRRRR